MHFRWLKGSSASTEPRGSHLVTHQPTVDQQERIAGPQRRLTGRDQSTPNRISLHFTYLQHNLCGLLWNQLTRDCGAMTEADHLPRIARSVESIHSLSATQDERIEYDQPATPSRTGLRSISVICGAPCMIELTVSSNAISSPRSIGALPE